MDFNALMLYQFNTFVWLSCIINYEHIIHTIMRPCWTNVFIHWHEKKESFVFIPQIFIQHNKITILSLDTRRGFLVLEQLFLPGPPHFNPRPRLHEWGKRSHSKYPVQYGPSLASTTEHAGLCTRSTRCLSLPIMPTVDAPFD